MRTDHRICIFLSGALGDFVNALPALSVLRQSYLSSFIELVGNPSWLPLLEEARIVDQVRSQEVLPLSAAFQKSLPCPNPLARFLEPFDLVLSWFGDPEGLWERALQKTCRGRVHVFPLHRCRAYPGHVSEYFLSTLRDLGIHEPFRGPFRFPWQKPADPEGKNPGRADPEDPPRLCIHPGSGSPAKNWMQERFLEVARSVRQRWNFEVTVLLGPAEKRQQVFWAEADSPGLSVVSDLPIVALARILSGTKLYVGNDSGVTHLASCLGVPVVALFGPTDTARWAPRGEHVCILQGKAACAPCGEPGQAKCVGPECLLAIETGQVLEAVERILCGINQAR